MHTPKFLTKANETLAATSRATDRAVDAVLARLIPQVDAADTRWQWLLGAVTAIIVPFEAWALSTTGSTGDTYSELAREAANAYLWVYPIAGAFTGAFVMILLRGRSLGFLIRLVLLGWTATFAHIFWWF